MNLIEIALIVLGTSVVEEVFFLLPSTLTSVASGALISFLNLSPTNFFYFLIYIVFPLSLGTTIGSTLWFLIARQGITLVYGRFDYLTKVINQSRLQIKNNPKNVSWFYFTLRATPIFSGLVATFIGGLLNISVLRHLVITFMGTLVRGGILAFIGWQIGELFMKYFKIYGWSVAVFTIIILIGFSLCTFYKKKL